MTRYEMCVGTLKVTFLRVDQIDGHLSKEKGHPPLESRGSSRSTARRDSPQQEHVCKVLIKRPSRTFPVGNTSCPRNLRRPRRDQKGEVLLSP